MNQYTLKIFVFGAVLITLCSGASLLGFFQLNASISTYKQVIEEDLAHSRKIKTVLIDFKTQVQEWKNTILRGSVKSQGDKYWAAFNDKQTDVQLAVEELLATLPEGAAKNFLTEFRMAHDAMEDGYSAGYEAFLASGYSASVGDAAVKGIDREPSALLDQASDAFFLEGLKSTIHAQSNYDKAVKFILATYLLIAISGLISAAWLARSVSRRIGENAPVEAQLT